MKKAITLILILYPLSGYGALIDDLVSYWKLDETSGSREDIHATNDLTDNNTVGAGTGIINDGADFESGNTEYLSITDGSQTGLDFADDFTISLWYKSESTLGTDTLYELVSKFGSAPHQYRFIYINSGGTTYLGAQLYDDGGGGNTAYLIAQTLTNATWYYLTFTWDESASTLEVFVNGSSIGTVVDGTVDNIADTGSTFAIGDLGAGVQGFMDGILDEVGVWSRKLDNTEITSLYNGGTALAYPFSGGSGTSTATSTATSTDQSLQAETLATIIFVLSMASLSYVFIYTLRLYFSRRTPGGV